MPINSLKRTALLVALDLSLKRMKRSPERCARNLIELGLTAYPDRLSKKEQSEIMSELMRACKSEDASKVRELFLDTFLLS